MARQYLPKDRRWIQSDNGTVDVFNIDLHEDRGKARVSKPLTKLIDEDTDFSSSGGELFDGYANSFVLYGDDYWANAGTMFYADDGVVLTESGWRSDGTGGTPSETYTTGQSVVWDGRLLAIDNSTNGRILSYNGTTWSTYLYSSGATVTKTIGDVQFLIPSEDGNLYVADVNNYVHRIRTDDTADWGSDGDAGTLDFSTRNYVFTCYADTSERLFIGFENKTTGRGGIIEWDKGASTLTANRVHQLSAIPRCIAVDDDVAIPIFSDGSIKYFNGLKFVDYPNARLPRIDGRYDDDFIHFNGWAIIDNMVHFLIKGGQTLNDASQYQKDTAGKITFPSAVYCLDPEVGLYPRFALRNLTGDYSLPSVNAVGALHSLNENGTKFLASYRVYTNNVGSAKSMMVYYDEANTEDSKGYIFFDSVERNSDSKNIEILHKVMDSGNSIKAYYQEFEADEQTANGSWESTTVFNTEDTLTVDENWIGWVKTGNGAGQFLRVDTASTGAVVTTVTFKDANSSVTLNDGAAITFIKYKWFGTADSSTKDITPLAFPSGAKTRKVKILYELTQMAGTTNKLDYSVIDT